MVVVVVVVVVVGGGVLESMVVWTPALVDVVEGV